MEDFHVVAKVCESGHVAAVFDGHSGHELSHFCAQNLTRHLADALKEVGNGVENVGALKRSLERIDASAKKEMPTSTAGTTACAVVVFPTEIITANIGDSRAILFSRENGGTTYDLSKDHKPDSPEEEDRIFRNGGFVTQPHQTDGVARVMGRLSLSRALGDWELRPWVSPSPDVTLHKRAPQDAFVVIASDGVWDVMSSHEVTTKVNTVLLNGGSPQDALNAVLQESRTRGSGDNVTIVLVDVGRKPLVPRLL